jgi:hypothetical protein
MKLEVHERIVLVSLLPSEGDYAALKTIRRAKEMLAFTPDEMKYYEFSDVIGPDGKPNVHWSPEKASKAVKDCPIDEYTTNLIRDKLADMNKRLKLTDQYMSLYEKFVVDYR